MYASAFFFSCSNTGCRITNPFLSCLLYCTCVGKRISLISNSDIRYDGTLFQINPNDSTVALKDVMSYGTEGRGNPDAQIPPNPTIQPCVIFAGQDIKDLHVHQDQEPAPKVTSGPAPAPAPASALTTPAAAAAPKPNSKKEAPKPTTKRHANNDKNANAPPKPPPSKTKTAESGNNFDGMFESFDEGKEVKNRDNSGLGGSSNGGGGSNGVGGGGGRRRNDNNIRTGNERRRQPVPSGPVGSGDSLKNRRVRGTDKSSTIATGTDFDFTVNEEDDDFVTEIAGVDDAPKSYNKDNFFDEISCDMQDRAEGQSSGLRGAKERELNMEAFGAISLGGNRRGRPPPASEEEEGGKEGGGEEAVRGEGEGGGGAVIVEIITTTINHVVGRGGGVRNDPGGRTGHRAPECQLSMPKRIETRFCITTLK